MLVIVLSLWSNVMNCVRRACCKMDHYINVYLSKPNTTPGPKGIPFLGHIFDLDFTKMHQQITRMSEVHGPLFKLDFLRRKLYVVTDAKLLDKAFRSETLGRHMNDRSVNITKHIFNDRKHIGFADLTPETNGLRTILWKHLRHCQTHSHVFQMHTVSAIDKLASSLTTDVNVNLDHFIQGFLTDLNSIILTGETLPEGSPDRDALWELIDLLYAMLDPAVDAPLRLFPFLRFLPTKHGRLYKNTIKARDRVAKIYFESQKATFEEGRTRGLVDVCLQMQADDVREKGSSWLSDDYIRGLMYDTTLAGMTEMMKSLRMLILLMCHHPDVQSRVYTEIADVIGSDTTPTSDHRARMPYTQAVVMEMLRYVSQTPLAIPHKCNKDVVLDGYLVEKDSGIVPNLWGIHHNEEVWGDPWTFRPDRFLDPATGNLIPADSATMKSFLPFSIGKRRCPGENFAMSRIFLIFSSLLQRLTFLPPDGEPLPSVDPRLYNNKFPLTLPVYTCKVLPRDHTQTS